MSKINTLIRKFFTLCGKIPVWVFVGLAASIAIWTGLIFVGVF